jgi:hypothetical protein
MLAESLMIRWIPKLFHIALVRDDVIDNACRHHRALLLVHNTQRMLAQEDCAVTTPSTAVPTRSR